VIAIVAVVALTVFCAFQIVGKTLAVTFLATWLFASAAFFGLAAGSIEHLLIICELFCQLELFWGVSVKMSNAMVVISTGVAGAFRTTRLTFGEALAVHFETSWFGAVTTFDFFRFSRWRRCTLNLVVFILEEQIEQIRSVDEDWKLLLYFHLCFEANSRAVSFYTFDGAHYNMYTFDRPNHHTLWMMYSL